MKQLILSAMLLASTAIAIAQDDVYPTPANTGTFYITNATIHVGNGQVIERGIIKVNGGKIESVGTVPNSMSTGVKTYDATGKHVYPGLILSNVNLGLQEVGGGSVRGSNDYAELGDFNPSIRSIVAYNSDSKVIGTLRSNGILLANVVPQGGTISGSSTVVQLDAWNWEDAAYKMDNGMHLNMPSLFARPTRGGGRGLQQSAPEDPLKQALDKIEEVKAFFRGAKAYSAETNHSQTNLKYEAAQNLFNKKEKLFVHCTLVKEMLIAVDFAKEFGFDVVIVGGSESWQIAPLLKQNNLSVILGPSHELPTTADDDVDQPYKTPAALQKAGVLFAINDDSENTRFRNLAFNAGTAVAYGLTKEEALSAITLNAARILGVDATTGSIEVGKDANIVISEGDILDMRTSIVTQAFIQGRAVSLNDKQKQLFERYKYKYGIK
jgi:imidazolonepropionase-like amidohydrolase